MMATESRSSPTNSGLDTFGRGLWGPNTPPHSPARNDPAGSSPPTPCCDGTDNASPATGPRPPEDRADRPPRPSYGGSLSGWHRRTRPGATGASTVNSSASGIGSLPQRCGAVLKASGTDPAPNRSDITWSELLHSQGAVACDFFAVDTAPLRRRRLNHPRRPYERPSPTHPPDAGSDPSDANFSTAPSSGTSANSNGSSSTTSSTTTPTDPTAHSTNSHRRLRGTCAHGSAPPSGREINPLPRPHQRIPKRSLTSHDPIFGPHTPTSRSREPQSRRCRQPLPRLGSRCTRRRLCGFPH
jgi:hypothetical protein